MCKRLCKALGEAILLLSVPEIAEAKEPEIVYLRSWLKSEVDTAFVLALFIA
jgi:hypothetical protein